MSSLSFTKSTQTIAKDEVYVAAVALRATKGPAQLFMSAAYSLNIWDLQHFMVIIKPSSPPLNSKAICFDFQPEDPENIYTAVAALSGRPVPGVVLTRRLRKVPRSRCWFVGYSEEDAVDKAYDFNNTWDVGLRVGLHDCRHYTNGLVEHLTGEKLVVEHLTGEKLVVEQWWSELTHYFYTLLIHKQCYTWSSRTVCSYINKSKFHGEI